jgi:hypothetical protein
MDQRIGHLSMIPYIFTRRHFLQGMFAATLAGCATNPNAITAETAPHDVAHSGKAYVAFEVYQRLGGIFGDTRVRNNALFVNTTAPFNPFYLRTPDNLKVQSMPLRGTELYALEPGTYRLAAIAVAKDLCEFTMDDSPVEFTLTPGEIVYVGALQYEYFSAGGIFDPHHYRVTFAVSDELEANRARIDQGLALLPGKPPIATRLMTLRRPDIEVSIHPKLFAPTPPAETQEAPPPPGEEPPPPLPPASTGPWHETPSP